MTVTIPTTDWQGGTLANGSPDRMSFRTAIFCPKCGSYYSLRAHLIDHDGTVRPSFECPFLDCTFNEHITLEGWAPAAAR